MPKLVKSAAYLSEMLRGETVCLCVAWCALCWQQGEGDRGHYASKYVERRDCVVHCVGSMMVWRGTGDMPLNMLRGETVCLVECGACSVHCVGSRVRGQVTAPAAWIVPTHRQHENIGRGFKPS